MTRDAPANIAASFHVAYDGFALAFEQTLPAAGITALFGPSGSGKTTLLRCFAGLLRAPGGRLRVGGEIWQDETEGVFLPPHRRPLGMVFQDAALFPHMTVRGNLHFGMTRAGLTPAAADFDAIVAMLDLGRLLERWPAALSGGEKQRAAIGRALLTRPRLLLMDEPLAALDHMRKQEILPYLERLRDGLSFPIFYVSHSMEEVARLADEAVVIDKGRVVAQGAPLDVLPGAARLIEGGRFGLTTSLVARVARVDGAYGVTRLAHPAGEILVTSRLSGAGDVRVAVKATDVALAKTRPEDTSVRTILRGRIRKIDANGSPLAFVTLDLAGDEKLVAAVTRLALDELGLSVGAEVFALVKSVALDERAL